jgi:hypothetical protein
MSAPGRSGRASMWGIITSTELYNWDLRIMMTFWRMKYVGQVLVCSYSSGVDTGQLQAPDK